MIILILFFVFKGSQIQTLGKLQSKVAINQLFLFSLSEINFSILVSQHEDLAVSMYSTDRLIAKAEQRRERHGKSRREKWNRETLREVLRVGRDRERTWATPLGSSESANYRSCIGLLFEFSVSNHTTLEIRAQSNVHRMRNFFFSVSSWLCHMSKFYV